MFSIPAVSSAEASQRTSSGLGVVASSQATCAAFVVQDLKRELGLNKDNSQLTLEEKVLALSY